jgi:ATP-binding cassette subfamily F protein 3
MVSINNLTVEFSGTPLFNDISFLINDRDRIGLVGKNGAGKTTLLKVLAGIQGYNAGSVAYPKDKTVGYLPQQMTVSDTKTVFKETLEAFDHVLSLQKEIENINQELVERTDYDSQSYADLINRLSDLTDRFNLLGGATIDADIENTLTGLGFERSDFDRPTGEFSGGWRMRIELAKVLLRKPDLLLLDEPTNHLDIESVQWFEEMLKTYEGAVIVVSHDKAFLDNLTNRTVEINFGKLYDFKVSYTKYTQLRKEQLDQQKAAYENQQKKIEETEDFIERFRYKATKAVQVQSRIKMLEKMDKIALDEIDASAIHFRFPPAPRSGDVVVEAKELTKAFGSHVVLSEIDMVIERGEKIALVGKNGEGKTTLSKVVIGEHEYSGHLKIGHNVKIGYYAQNQSEMLDDKLTVFQVIDNVATGDMRTKVRDILASFLFRGEDIDKKVSVLSGGERARLSLAKLMLEPANLLVLDEPTNHLDMRSKDILKQALLNYDGTLILVSHDRDFLDGVVDTVYEFRHKKAKQHLGGIAEFLQKKRLEHLNQLNEKAKAKSTSATKAPTEQKLKYEERKEIEKLIRKAQKLVDASEEKIMELEGRVEELDQLLANPENINGTNIYQEYEQVKNDLATEMERWEKHTGEVEVLKAQKEQGE